MPVPPKRMPRNRVRTRRAHHALTNIQLNTCPKCGASVRAHLACPECGTYRGRNVTKPRS